MSPMNPDILVVGSANVDFTVTVDRLPQRGETVSGGDFRLAYGGKGANQALAAKRAGTAVLLVAKVGRDPNGELLYQRLIDAGLSARGLLRDDDAPAGVALIMVDPQGHNLIAVAPGSNHRLTKADVQALGASACTARILLTQLEVPLETVEYVLHRGRESGMTTVLNPAPGRQLTDALLTLPEIITPNETEASILSGLAVTGPETAAQAGARLLARGCRTVIITLGAQGSLLVRHGGVRHFPPFPVTPVDSTAAGDAFNGALAVALLEGLTIERAMVYANAAGALCVTKRGAQEALPTRQEIEALLRKAR